MIGVDNTTRSAPPVGAERVLRARDLQLLCVALVVISVVTEAAHPTPEDVVRTSIEGLRQAVQRDAARIEHDPTRVIPLLERHVVPYVDTGLFARLVLGPHWKLASQAQRAAFTVGLANSLLRVYGVHAGLYSDARVNFLGTHPVGDRPDVALVRTEVSTSQGPPSRIDYRMVWRNGEWKAIDATVDGISIVRTYRAAMDDEIRRVGMDRVIERLRNAAP